MGVALDEGEVQGVGNTDGRAGGRFGGVGKARESEVQGSGLSSWLGHRGRTYVAGMRAFRGRIVVNREIGLAGRRVIVQRRRTQEGYRRECL